MRVDLHSVGSVMHVMKRGARGMEIVRDDHDRYNFVRSIYLLNDTYQDNDWRTYVIGRELFYRPKSWPPRTPLVSILAWTLLDNHFHLMLQEEREGGIAKFMQRLGGSMTLFFNKKYKERGSIFQGGYKGRVVNTEEYLQYVHSYIIVKNVFEMYPGGLGKASSQFDKAWIFAGEYPFSSFITASTGAPSPILNITKLDSLGLLRKDFKDYARSMIVNHALKKGVNDNLASTLLEKW